MTGAAGALEQLSADEIDAVGVLWKRQGRQFVTSFSGISMLPAIAPGQPVAVTCGIEPAVGDVAVFRYDNHVGVHRVVEARCPLLEADGGLSLHSPINAWGEARAPQ